MCCDVYEKCSVRVHENHNGLQTCSTTLFQSRLFQLWGCLRTGSSVVAVVQRVRRILDVFDNTAQLENTTVLSPEGARLPPSVAQHSSKYSENRCRCVLKLLCSRSPKFQAFRFLMRRVEWGGVCGTEAQRVLKILELYSVVEHDYPKTLYKTFSGILYSNHRGVLEFCSVLDCCCSLFFGVSQKTPARFT